MSTGRQAIYATKSQEIGDFVAKKGAFPSILPDTFTEGRTKDEALFNVAEVLSGMLAWHLDEGTELPLPSVGHSHTVGIIFHDAA